MRGRVRPAVVNVGGSWCPPCKAEAADLQAASEDTAGVLDREGRLAARVLGPIPRITLVQLVNDTASGT